MQTYEIETLPCVGFAHAYHADTYFNVLKNREDSMEISFISQGSQIIQADGKEYVAEEGDIIVFPFKRRQDAINVKSSSFHEHYTVFAYLSWSVRNNANGLLLPLITPAKLNTQSAVKIIDRLVQNPLVFKDSRAKGAAKFLELLCEIDRCNRREQSNVSSDILYTRRAKEYVQGHLRLPVREKEVAQHLSISPEYLCAVFKKVEGISFQKYVNYEKLEAIKDLMEKESARLYEAAAFFGYNDPNYVSRLFKKYYGHNLTNKQTESFCRDGKV